MNIIPIYLALWMNIWDGSKFSLLQTIQTPLVKCASFKSLLRCCLLRGPSLTTQFKMSTPILPTTPHLLSLYRQHYPLLFYSMWYSFVLFISDVPLVCKLHEGRRFGLFWSPLSPQGPMRMAGAPYVLLMTDVCDGSCCLWTEVRIQVHYP